MHSLYCTFDLFLCLLILLLSRLTFPLKQLYLICLCFVAWDIHTTFYPFDFLTQLLKWMVFHVIMFINITITFLGYGNITDTTDAFNDTISIYDTYDYFIHPHWKQFGLVPDHWHYIVGIYITIVGITGIVGNAIVIWIFSTYV